MRRHRARVRRQLGGETGDPLDGLVNLFDLGIVLAVAFLIAGLASTIDRDNAKLTPRAQQQSQQRTRAVPTPAQSAPVRGKGKAVGTVYRLGDGRLIYTRPRGGG
ncbi:DUF2149 domain-containing protein [Baekduia sp.]|jgi:hypothetical protein|uniref:DUF2149 domain-containing protein n=1 Tax=Baekduia sp. TaxID=2600305 RepID=UPI002DFB36D2|nr:DUF2149 domain-containing protein [Baekduia sp.]